LKSTYGKPQIHVDLIFENDNITFTKGKTIKSFNLWFTKLYNQIPNIISPQNKVAMMHYYNIVTPTYHHRLEEKNVSNLWYYLQICLEYEALLCWTYLKQSIRGTLYDIPLMNLRGICHFFMTA